VDGKPSSNIRVKDMRTFKLDDFSNTKHVKLMFLTELCRSRQDGGSFTPAATKQVTSMGLREDGIRDQVPRYLIPAGL
jgi:hypothetical protein